MHATQPTILLISGSREATPGMLAYADQCVERAHRLGWSVVVGDADGIDARVIEKCDELKVPVEVHGAKGKMRCTTKTQKNITHDCGYLARDNIMAGICTCCLAVWNGRSRGTKATFQYTKALGKPAWLMDFSQPKGKRMQAVNGRVSTQTGGSDGIPRSAGAEGGKIDPDH